MPMPTITKKCEKESDFFMRTSQFEKRFEEFVEEEVKKIMENPQKYPSVKVIYGKQYESDEF